MAESSTGQKRGPGRPPGSKNKNRTGTGTGSKASSSRTNGNKSSGSKASGKASGPTRQEVIDEMQRRSDVSRRNNDIIWSITLFAIGLFLFFTIVMDTTGSFGMRIHDLFKGLFGIMAFVLPFFVFIIAILLMAGKLQHIGARTAIFSVLIFINMCILNSYRYIDPSDIKFGLEDMLDYFVAGIDGEMGGAIGMELGSILAKLFGMPGLLIISVTVLVISIFLVANSPISRFAEKLSKKSQERRILRELEADERQRISEEEMAAALSGSPTAAASLQASASTPAPAQKKSIWKAILNGITRDEDEPVTPAAENTAAASAASDIPEPFGRLSSTDNINSGSADDIVYTQVMPSPLENSGPQTGRNTLFGRIKGYFAGMDGGYAGIDSETGEKVTARTLARSAQPLRIGMDGNEPSQKSIFEEERNFEAESEDFGYKGRKRQEEKSAAVSTGLGLGDPDYVGHSGSYGLDAHNTGGARRSAGSAAAGAAASKAAEAAEASGSGQEQPSRRISTYTDDNTRGSRPSERTSVRPAASKEKDAGRNISGAVAAASDNKKQAGETLTEDEEEKLAAGFSSSADDSDYEFPPVSLLKKDTGSKQLMSSVQLEEKADLLEQTLNNFGVDAKVINVTQGASVTRYEVQPAVGVKVSKITSLADDIALNLRAKSIRIEAPIPGKAAVGIEVENDKPAPVLIRELIDSEEFRDAPSKITFVVGKDISGNNIVADLHDMPHMLIAGATGSGKSVCINTIITSFLYKARPSELKLIMVDPKVVELGNYNGIPHMLTPVVTDPRKASRALAIAVEEMDKRYESFAQHNVKDLESYNELMRANHRYADCKPQIVIIIDELADLMMAAPSEVENSICRLAQKARAAGMHLIVATQRPSVDVVTGLIKANIPSRIAFSVASQFDSRTILDMAGAEKLLGKGDMLFSPVGSTKPYRVQGPFISEKETDRIIKFVKKEGGLPAYDEELRNAIENAEKKGASAPQDELTDDAIAFIFKSKQASVSMLQRRFRIGYNRAARIIDEIEEKGIIGPSDGSRPRQLLITEEEYYGAGEDAGRSDAGTDMKASAAGGAAIPSNNRQAASEAPDLEGAAAAADAPHSVNPDNGNRLSHTQAMDSFNSLPESVRRMVMNTDGERDS